MKKELYIQIPEPCHEDWNKMTPVQQGRFCQSCSKEVVDFSLMTDQDIINFLSKPRGKSCGHFATDQLNRIIKEPATPAKKRIWAMMLSFLLPLFISNKSKAQFRPKRTADTVKTQPDCTRVLLGKIAVREQPISIIVSGVVTDSSGEPLPNATILIKGTHIGTSANSKGEYRLSVTGIKSPVLQVSFTGFENKEIVLTPNSDSIHQDIRLTSQQNQLEEVVVVASGTTTRRGYYAGGFSIVRTEQIQIPVIDTVKNLIKPSLLKVYPNPASKSSFVNVQLTNTGEYLLKLVDNDGRLIQQNSFTISAKRQAYQLELPSTISSGIYYINVTDEKSKKQYIQKLFVQ